MNKYPEYKDSGVKWLGDIPSEWQILRLKSLVIKSTNGVWGTEPEEDENDLVCVRVADFDMDKFGVSEKKLTTRNIPSSQQNGRLLSKDNLLIEKSGGGEKQTVGRVIKYDLDIPAVCSNFIAKIECENNADPNYLVYLFSYLYSVGVNTRSIKQTTGIQNLDTGLYFNERVSIPLIEEQTVIANFLDQKTQQIDDLISKKQQLIELLKEERTAVINQAVTKGLDPDVPMKDSGIEWLGEIPEHWRYIPLKYFTERKTGIQTGPFGTQLNTKDYVADGIKVINQKTLIEEDYSLGDEFISIEKFESLKGFEVRGGDVILGTRGSFGIKNRTTFGKCSIVPDKHELSVLHPCLIRIRFETSEVLKSYLYFYINDSSLFLDDIRNTSNSTTIEVIYGITLRDIRFPIPPIIEQKQILDFLREQTNSIDKAINQAESSIELLIEYKTSLINEAVTGKIDVRDYQISHATE